MSRYTDAEASRYRQSSAYSQTGDWFTGTIRRNPEALLLLGAGFCLLMRSGSGWTSPSAGYSRGAGGRSTLSYPGSEGSERDWSDRASTARQGLSRAAESAGDYASDVKDRVSRTAGAYAESVSDLASEAGRQVSEAGRQVYETTGRWTRQAQSSLESGFERVLRDQPLAVAIAGLAAGAAVAAAFPSTDIENRTLGEARERLVDAAGRAGQNLMGAAGKAGERLKSAAAERGLTSEGLKDLAGDVADTFTSAAKGEAGDHGSPTVVPESPSTDLGSSQSSRSSNMAGMSNTGGRSTR